MASWEVLACCSPLSGRWYNVFLSASPQLEMYSKKFDEFQGTVSKSNSVYSGFKQDMDKVRALHHIGYIV